MTDAIHSTRHQDIERALHEMLLARIRDPKVQAATRDVVALIDKNAHGRLYKNGDLGPEVTAIMERHALSAEQYYALTNMLTLVVHLARASTITAAANDTTQHPQQQIINRLLDTLSSKIDPISNRRIRNNASAAELVEHMNHVTMENVFTAHPTYIGDPDYALKLSELDTQIAARDLEAAGKTLDRLMEMNLLISGRFKAQDETRFMTQYLSRAFDTMPTICTHYDEAFAKAGYADYDPLSLNLDVNFRSWGSSGDKDGNNNITCWSLKDAVETHRSVAIGHYEKALQSFRNAFAGDAPFLRRIDQLESELKQLAGDASHGGERPEKLQSALRHLARDVYAQYPDHHHPVAQQALALYRNVNIFGMGMGTIEFRETADVLQFVLNHVLTEATIAKALGNKTPTADHYSALTADEKTQVLNFALGDKVTHDALKAQIDAAEAAIPTITEPEEDNPRGRQFAYKDTGEGKHNYGVFYHTIKRLELAKSNPDMFKGQVLAEAEHPNQLKEMLLLLKATGTDKQIRVIPLFEDPEVLAALESKTNYETGDDTLGIMDTLHRDPHIFRHLVEVSLAEWDDKVKRGLHKPLPETVKVQVRHLADILAKAPYDNVKEEYQNAKGALEDTLRDGKLPSLSEIITTQSQLAHSDNTRRGGMAGARAGIFKAHQVIRESAGELGFGANMYEGGSHTDSFRMGVRSYRSLVNLYNNHRFMKATVQGMDLAQLFSSPNTIAAYIEENLANATRRMNERSLKGYQTMDDDTAAGYVNRGMMSHDRILDTVINEVDTYRNDFFGGSGKAGDLPPNIILGNIIAQVFNYEENSKAGTLGSRGGSRAGAKDQSLYLNPVTDTRTIGYSETFQHGGLNPNFIGAGRLGIQLCKMRADMIAPDPAKPRSFAARTGHGNEGVFIKSLRHVDSDQYLHTLYTHNSMLRDAIDRTAFAIATTNFDVVWDHAMHDYTHGKREPRTLKIGTADQLKTGQGRTETITEKDRPKPEDLPRLAEHRQDSARNFLAWMELEYREAATMVMEAIDPKSLDRIDPMTCSAREIASAVRDILPMYKDMMARQDVMMEVANHIQHHLPRSTREQTYDSVENGLNKGLHNLRDVVTLSRPPFRQELRNQGILKDREPFKQAAIGA